MKPLVALQIIGSPTSEFFYNLSLLYGKEVVRPAGFELIFVIAYPDGKWSVSKSLDERSVKVSFSRLVEAVRHADLAVPHMFCQKGLTSIRILFEDLLGIPLVGSSGHVLNIAQDKQLTKLLATEADVRVPFGKRLKQSDSNFSVPRDMKFPLIIKPNHSDNSDGLTLAHNEGEFQLGIKKAFRFNESVLVETYIPGRELRGAILEINNQFTILPFIEYGVHADNPIRYATDKLKFDEAGNLISQSEKLKVPAQCPAEIDDLLLAMLSNMMKKMHRVLGCRDFSMYDFRVHEDTGVPYLLEAGLFWSFSETSMISSMLRTDGRDLREVTGEIWKQRI